MATQPTPENTPQAPAPELPPAPPAPREFAEVIPYSYARTAHPTRAGETVSATARIGERVNDDGRFTGTWDTPRIESRHGIAISPNSDKPQDQPKSPNNPDGYEYKPRRVEAAGLAGRTALRRLFGRTSTKDSEIQREPLPGIPGVLSEIPERTSPQPFSNERETAQQAAIAKKMQEREEDAQLRAEERDLRRREHDLRRRSLDLAEQQLAKGVVPSEYGLAQTGSKPEQSSANPALERYKKNLALIERYENDPKHRSLFEEERLKSLHTAIQEAAWPLYEARMAELNRARSKDEIIQTVEDMPSSERRQIVDPIDKSYTREYVTRSGDEESEELFRALTLARLKAVGKLRKPQKPQA